MHGKAFRWMAWALLATVSSLALGAADDLLDQARQLLAKRDAKAAYALLSPIEIKRAGDPEFDYLLGISALDSGNLTRAVFALERVLAVNPAHSQARAEIARAYFELGETSTAKREFESVRSAPLPAEAARAIDNYLDAISRLGETGRTRITAYIEGVVGRDSNVNAGPSNNQVAVPSLGGTVVTLSPGGAKAADNFASLQSGASLRHPVTSGVALLAGVNVNKRMNDTQDTFDTGYWDANLGLGWTTGPNILTLALQGSQLYVDNLKYRHAYGVVGQWQRNLDARNQVSIFGQYTELRYDNRPGVQNDLRDANRTVAGVGYAHAFSLGPVAFVSAYLGDENERADARSDLGHSLRGLRLGGQYAITPKVMINASAGVERREFGGLDAAFLVTRGDTQYSASLGASYEFARDWKLNPQISYTHNNSNIAINDYRREIYSIGVRRDF